ncbi:hypothetical protein GW17_00035341 [Ensete ventricosum]|nr:hypothetical protein GW17_00035341 [Ensete ventricosum]
MGTLDAIRERMKSIQAAAAAGSLDGSARPSTWSYLILGSNVYRLPSRPVDLYNGVRAASTRGAPCWQSEVGGCRCSGCDFDAGLSNLVGLLLQDKTSQVVGSRGGPSDDQVRVDRKDKRPWGDILYLYVADQSSLGFIIPLAFFASPFNVAGNADDYTCCREIVYPCIPDLDGEDEGGQASSSLAVSTRWISAAKLLQSDLATLAQREGGE